MGIDLLIWQRYIERVDDGLDLKREPPTIAGDVGQEFLLVARSAEGGESWAILLGDGIGGSFIDGGGGNDRFHNVEFFRGHGVYLIKGDEAIFGDTESFVFVEAGSTGHLAFIVA